MSDNLGRWPVLFGLTLWLALWPTTVARAAETLEGPSAVGAGGMVVSVSRPASEVGRDAL
jgi:hypothetical protein